MNRILFFGAVVALCGLSAPVHAQSEPESSVLVIESAQGQGLHELHVTERLHYETKSGARGKGQIESIQDSSVTVAGQEVRFSELKTVAHVKGHKHPRGSGLLRKSLWGMLIAGLLFLIAVVLAGGRTTSGERGLMLVLGLLALVFFPILLLIALITLATSRKKFELGDQWRIRRG